MKRISVLLVLLVITRVHAETPAAPFDSRIVTAVYAEALSFMAPRTLEPASISQMTLWGLRGLTALDPAVQTSLQDGRLRLTYQGKVQSEALAPKEERAVLWANAAAALAVAAANVSPVVRRAGPVNIVQFFFDELFNHLDPYSRYVSPVDAVEDRARRTGRAGLGVTVVRQGNGFVVQGVIREGPAYEIGMRNGDAVTAIDRQPVRTLDLKTVVGLLEGPEETTVHLTWRGRDGRVHESDAVRALVPPETVFIERVGPILIIRITAFSRTTDSHLALALREGLTGSRPATGLVLDLRGNRGGLLRQAVSAADILLPAGVVAISSGRAPESNYVWRSTSGELGREVPVIILVDGRTASAAEILAAALADRGRGVVVGSVTLGKGLVQTIGPLPDGGELFVTWSRVLAPLGWPIQGLGLLPQVCTSKGIEFLREQMASLASGEQSMEREIVQHRLARAPLSANRMLGIRAACPAAEGRELDIEAARHLIANPTSYQAALLPPTDAGQ